MTIRRCSVQDVQFSPSGIDIPVPGISSVKPRLVALRWLLVWRQGGDVELKFGIVYVCLFG